ncbi:hypothetical protein KIL84_008626 [Mauremys mutica]|uniref:Uncharacterized protein n=1 Tax=Mauremys mutica TaxID=74926 RepID=A0A9D3X8V8_9SAUR|nr:hypothetical protein KIL84_008626 [Mauremys mutica]
MQQKDCLVLRTGKVGAKMRSRFLDMEGDWKTMQRRQEGTKDDFRTCNARAVQGEAHMQSAHNAVLNLPLSGAITLNQRHRTCSSLCPLTYSCTGNNTCTPGTSYILPKLPGDQSLHLLYSLCLSLCSICLELNLRNVRIPNSFPFPSL